MVGLDTWYLSEVRLQVGSPVIDRYAICPILFTSFLSGIVLEEELITAARSSRQLTRDRQNISKY